MRDSLEDLKAGDSVIVRTGGWGIGRSVETVQKVHKLHLVVRGVKYRRDNGYSAGQYSRGSIEKASPEKIEEIRTEMRDRTLTHKIDSVKWRDVSLAKKIRIAEILEEEEPS